MLDNQKEHEDLEQADRDIADGEHRLAEQKALVHLIAERGESTLEAEKVLRNFEQVLETFRAHRQLIVDTLERK